MPNLIDANGLQTKTYDELQTDLTADLQAAYGDDINLESDTPDGQLMNIYIQATLDNLDLIAQTNAGFDPDQAIGRILDSRVGLNGIQRKAGTFTRTPIQVVTDRALTLPGLDASIDDPNGTGYTVSDNAGNQFILEETQVVGAAGTYSFEARAQNIGSQLTTPNTITVPVTVVVGVVSVNNPTTFTSLGLAEELDSDLRERRRKSVSISGQGWRDSLKAALDNINGVTYEEVYENTSGATDGDGIPGHSIWVIVDGGDVASIANAIYRKRNAGCGMLGAQVVPITQRDGTIFEVKYDLVVNEDLFIQFHVESINGIDIVDPVALKAGLVTLLVPGVFQTVNITQLGTLVQQIDPNAFVVPTVGDGFALTAPGPYANILTPDAKNKRFTVSGANISITVV